MRRALLLLSVLLVAGLAPGALAQSLAPPASAAAVEAGGARVAHWVGTADAADANVTLGETGTLWVALERPAGTANASIPTTRRAYLNLTSDALAFAAPALVVQAVSSQAQGWSFANASFTSSATAAGPASYAFTVEVYEEGANGTVLLGASTGQGTVTLASVPVPQPPGGVPTPYLVGGGAAVVVGGAAALYALRQRRERRVMNEAPRRSQVMREMELERQLEKVEEKEPERAAEIKQEIRAQEVVREKRRELQILEAKRADALRTMDLLRKRHEAGGLSKLQFDNMVAKKQADLQRIEADIAQMEAEDAAGGAAA
jgi:hypothetical protein